MKLLTEKFTQRVLDTSYFRQTFDNDGEIHKRSSSFVIVLLELHQSVTNVHQAEEVNNPGYDPEDLFVVGHSGVDSGCIDKNSIAPELS